MCHTNTVSCKGMSKVQVLERKESQTIHTHIIFCIANSNIMPRETTGEPQQDLRRGKECNSRSFYYFFTRKITSDVLIFIHCFPILFVSYFLKHNLNKILWLHHLSIDLQNAISLPFNISLQYIFFFSWFECLTNLHLLSTNEQQNVALQAIITIVLSSACAN